MGCSHTDGGDLIPATGTTINRILVLVDSPEAARCAVQTALCLYTGPPESFTLLGIGPAASVHAAGYISVSGLEADILKNVRSWVAVAMEQVPPHVAVQSRTIVGKLVPTLRRVLSEDPHDLMVISRRCRRWSRWRAALTLGHIYRACPIPVVVVPSSGISTIAKPLPSTRPPHQSVALR